MLAGRSFSTPVLEQQFIYNKVIKILQRYSLNKIIEIRCISFLSVLKLKMKLLF